MNPSSPLIPLDLDDLLHRLLLDKSQLARPRRHLRHGLHPWYQEGVTLTVLDPLRLAPPIESASEQERSMRQVCESFGIPQHTADVIVRNGVTSITLLALLPEEKIDAMIARRKEGDKVKDVVHKLNEKRPLEPLYSLKRLFHHRRLQAASSEKKRAAALSFLDLAGQLMKQGGEISSDALGRYREMFNEAYAVQRKLLVATYGGDTVRKRPKPPSRASSPEKIIRFKSGGGEGKENHRPNHNNFNKNVCQQCRREFFNPRGFRYCQPCYRPKVALNRAQLNRQITTPCYSPYGNGLPFLTYPCFNASQGCTFQGSGHYLEQHFNQECHFGRCFCPWSGCQFQGTAPWLVTHLDFYHKPLDMSFPQPESPLSFSPRPPHFQHPPSEQATFVLRIPPESIFPQWPRRTTFPFAWEPRRFHFDHITFYQILLRQVEHPPFNKQKNGAKPGCNKPQVKYYFWIWALAAPCVASKYVYELVVPHGAMEEGGKVHKYNGVAKSVQVSKESVLSKRYGTLSDFVFVPEGVLMKNIACNGKFSYRINICR